MNWLELSKNKPFKYDFKKIKRRSISWTKLLMHMCIYIHNNETMMADCTIKDSTYVWHDRLHVFLFSSEKLEKDKHLKHFVLHLNTDFIYTLNHYCLFIQRQYTKLLLSFMYIYIYYIYIYLYNIWMYIYMNIYMYLFIWYMTEGKIFFILLFWNEYSTLMDFCPFIRHPLSKLTLQTCAVRKWLLDSLASLL